MKENTVHEENGNGYNQYRQQNQQAKHSFANDFDFSNLVLGKLKDLRMKYKRPVTLNVLGGEFGQKIARADLIEILRGLQEAGEIRNVPGQELSYDVY